MTLSILQARRTIKPWIFGIHGHAGVGKDSAANYLSDRYHKTVVHAFADPLKLASSELFGISQDKFWDREEKEKVDDFWGVTPRQIAQFVGTELVRHNMWKLLNADTEDFWIRRLIKTIEFNEYTESHIVIIPDVRFQNEYDWVVQNQGHILYLTRPGEEGKVGIPSHQSEKPIDMWHTERTHHVNNAGTLNDLHKNVDEVFRKFCEYAFPTNPV